jgi:sepiapterin reductase
MNSHSLLVVITGSSRGIGRAIAISIANACSKEQTALPLPIKIVLIARTEDKLMETARLVGEKCGDTTNITTSCHAVDLSDLDSLSTQLNNIFEPLKQASYDHCWLFNNAGSVEPLGPTSSLANGSIDELRSSIDLNVTASMWLSSMFAKTFSSPANSNTRSIRIVNISSLCAIEPFATMAVYCAGKSARDMFHTVLAKEMAGVDERKENSTTDVVNHQFKVLNYAPGACDTKMTDVLADCTTLDAGLHDYFTSSKKECKLIDPADSASKLVEILIKDEYISGSHLDYWDI